MARKADPGSCVDGQPHVSRIGQSRAAGMQTDANSDSNAVRPGPDLNLALDRERGVETGARLLEDGEHLVRAGFDFAATRCADRRPEQAPDVGQKPIVSVAQPSHEPSRVLDVGEEEGDDARWQRARFSGTSLDLG